MRFCRNLMQICKTIKFCSIGTRIPLGNVVSSKVTVACHIREMLYQDFF